MEATNGNGDSKVPTSERERAVRLYQTTDISVEEIGKRFGVSRQTVHNWLKSAGVEKRGPITPRRGSSASAVVDADMRFILEAVQREHEITRQQGEALRADWARLMELAGRNAETLARIQGALDALVAMLSSQRTPE